MKEDIPVTGTFSSKKYVVTYGVFRRHEDDEDKDNYLFSSIIIAFAFIVFLSLFFSIYSFADTPQGIRASELNTRTEMENDFKIITIDPDATPASQVVKNITYSNFLKAYFPDADESDQGIAGDGLTVNTFVNTLSIKSGTIILKHTDPNNDTAYLFETNETIPSKIILEIEPGAYIDGNATLTIYSPENIKAGIKQKIFGDSITIAFTKPGEQSSGWWGDIGDGSTDDTSAIQASIDCAEATHAANVIRNSYLHDGPTVLIPGGVHLVTGLTVNAQIMIKGMGNQNTYIKSSTDAVIIDANMLDTVNYQPPVFRDFAIYGDPNLTSQTGINSYLHCRLENMVISWVGGDGFKSTKGNTIEILHSKIQNNGGYGIHLTGTYNTNYRIVENVIRENTIGIYIAPSSGTFMTGFILNNLIEANVAVKGSRYTSSQIGDPNERVGVGIWLKDVQYLTIADNYFENQLNDIYGEEGVSFCTFKNNYHGGSLYVPEDFPDNGGPYRKMQNVTISGQGNCFERCRFNRPVKPDTTDPNDWGTVFSGTTGTITDVDDGFGYLTHVASVELTSGDVAAMGLSEGDWIHITGITGTVGTDSSYGLNDHSFQIVGISGEKLAIEHTDLTGLTYTSGGTVQLATTWSYEYEHIIPGTRATIEDCIWQANSGTQESIIIRYADQTNVTVINTGKASSASKYSEQGPLYMVYGSPRTVTNMWQGYYYKYFNKISAMDAKHQFYCLPTEKHFFEHITTNIAGEPAGDAVEAFAISNNGLTFTDQVIDTNNTAIDTKTPGTKLSSSGGGMSLTMGDGHYTGQIKLISMSGDNGDVDVSVTHHEIDDPYKCIFDDVYDYWLLMWEGIEWTTIRATCTGGEINVSDKGYPNYLAADHGIYDGEITTLKYFVDTISSNNGTIVLKHNSIDNLTTQYVFNTDETIPSNITLKVEPGAYIDGNATLTINGSFDGASDSFSSGFNVIFGVKAVTENFHYGPDTASDDDYIITMSSPYNDYIKGMHLYFDANNPNVGACTANFNSWGAKSIKILHDNDPNDNCIEAGMMVDLMYDGTNFQMMNPCAN